MTADGSWPSTRSCPATPSGGISNPVLGMLLFITSEVMFFAGLFAAYFTIRAGYTEGLPPVHVWPPTEFVGLLKVLPLIITDTATGTTKLNLILPATIILVISSFTCQMAVWAIRRDDHTGFRRGIAVTLLLGILFLLMQAYDYTVLFSEGLSMGVDAVRDDVLHAHRVPRRARVRRGADAGRRALSRAWPGSSRRSTTTWSRRRRSTGTSSTWSGSSCS